MGATWDKALYDLAYDLPAEPDGHPNTRPGIRLHYNRAVLFPDMQRRAEFFISQFGLTASSKVLVVGCGFGWTVEALNAAGVPAVGTDLSAYVHGNKGVPEDDELRAAITAAGLNPDTGEGAAHFTRLGGGKARTAATVLNEDSSTTQSRNRVKTALGGNITLIITEDVLTSLTDAECTSLQSAIVKYGATIPICHLVTEFANPNPPFNFNSKSLAAWKAFFPTATIVADGYKFRVA